MADRNSATVTECFTTKLGTFFDFTLKAEIPPFKEGSLPCAPPHRTRYKDDVTIEHFQRSTKHYAGKKRRGVVDDHLGRLSMGENVNASLSARSSSLRTLLYRETSSLQLYSSAPPPRGILSFRHAHLNKLDSLVRDTAQLEEHRNDLIPAETRPADGKIKIETLRNLPTPRHLGRTIWIQQLLFGFPLVGRLSQRETFHT